MRIENQGATTHVYGRYRRPHFSHGVTAQLARRCAAVVLAFVLAVTAGASLMAPTASADEATPSPTTSQSMSPSTSPTDETTVDPNSSYILDTQNLLGNDIAKVSDAITRTRERTGVQVRLIYVDSFNSTDSPDDWARQTLRSLDPAPNTVLLAVATNDGNLAVVVSPGSDEWLSSQKSVDALSEAASAPLTGVKAGESPDWARSAIDMMDVIIKEKDTSTSSSVTMVGIAVLIGVVALAAVVVVIIVVRRRREVDDAKDVSGEEEAVHDDDADAAKTADDTAAKNTDAAAGAAASPVASADDAPTNDTSAAAAAAQVDDPHAKYKG